HLAVGLRRAAGNGLQMTPDLPLERRRADVDRQVAMWDIATQVCDDRPHPLAMHAIVADEQRARGFPSEVLFEHVVAIRELYRADAAIGGGAQQTPDG